MSVISTLAGLFQRGVVPSAEWAIALGRTPAQLASQLQARLGQGVSISPSVLVQFRARVQLAMQRGAALERGESVPPQLIPVDPTLFGRESYRYRVRVDFVVDGTDVGNTVISVPSDRPLTAGEAADIAAGIARNHVSQNADTLPASLGIGQTMPSFMVSRTLVVSVYRAPEA